MPCHNLYNFTVRQDTERAPYEYSGHAKRRLDENPRRAGTPTNPHMTPPTVCQRSNTTGKQVTARFPRLMRSARRTRGARRRGCGTGIPTSVGELGPALPRDGPWHVAKRLARESLGWLAVSSIVVVGGSVGKICLSVCNEHATPTGVSRQKATQSPDASAQISVQRKDMSRTKQTYLHA